MVLISDFRTIWLPGCWKLLPALEITQPGFIHKQAQLPCSFGSGHWVGAWDEAVGPSEPGWEAARTHEEGSVLSPRPGLSSSLNHLPQKQSIPAPPARLWGFQPTLNLACLLPWHRSSALHSLRVWHTPPMPLQPPSSILQPVSSSSSIPTRSLRVLLSPVSTEPQCRVLQPGREAPLPLHLPTLPPSPDRTSPSSSQPVSVVNI